MVLRLFFVFFVIISSCSQAIAADLLWLKNGDRLSGKILSKTGEKLLFKSPYAGKIEINWQEVERFSTEKPLIFVLGDENRLVGKAVAVEAGGISIVAGAVLKTAPLSPADIAAIHPRDYRESSTKVSGRINVGFAGNSGNTDTSSLHADGELVARTEVNRYTVGGALNWAKAADLETESNISVYSKYDHFLDKNWYLSVNASFLKDRFKDLRLRSKFGAGVGYQIWESKKRNLSLECGASYVNQDYFSAPDEDYPGARWALHFDHFLFDSLTQFFHHHELNVGLENVKDLLFVSETGLRFPLKNNFNATMQFNYDYDNTPAEGKKRDDEAYMVNFGYSW